MQCAFIVLPAFTLQNKRGENDMKYIPLVNLKNTTGIVAFCKEAKEIVRICEKEMGKVVPVLRNGIDELYVMDYEAYRMRKECFIKLL